MKKRENLWGIFIVFLILSLLIFGLSKTGFLNAISSLTTSIFSPVERVIYVSFKGVGLGEGELKTLRSENLNLTKKLVDQQQLQREINALRSQFETSFPKSNTLLAANIIGAPSFIPNLSIPETVIINKGSSDRVMAGSAVIFKDNLVGRVTSVLSHTASVELVSHAGLSFTAKSARTGSLGVIKGGGNGEMILDNVLLSDDLRVGDIILTSGDVSNKGTGLLAGLTVGKVISIDKKPSAVFQRADVVSLLDLAKLDMVFVVLETN